MTSHEKPDPVAETLAYARKLATSSALDEKRARITEHFEALHRAALIAQSLMLSWNEEHRTLQGRLPGEHNDSTETIFTFDPGAGARAVHARLRAFVTQKPKPSVRGATLAAIYFLGPLTSGEALDTLGAHGFKFGKGPAGNQVRSALWHARKNGFIKEEDGKQKFRDDSARKTFAVRHFGGEVPP